MASHITGLSDSNTLVTMSEYPPLEATLDIIGVHGMNLGGNQTHAESTWTHDTTGVNWLRDLLPEQVPNARILAFQYNANVAFNTSIAGVEEQAINLLECLMLKRKVVGPLCGIIVKEALATAFRDREAYPMIWPFTKANFFLAVPYKGSVHAAWGQVVANVYRAATIQPRLVSLVQASILTLLPRKDEALEKALEGQEAEQNIMTVETWAIESLNKHRHAVLQASHMLRHAISLRFEPEDLIQDGQIPITSLQLSSRANTLERKLQEGMEFTVRELHERHKKYNRAKAGWDKIEEVRKEVAGKNDGEFWITAARTVHSVRDDGEGSLWFPCVIL